MPYSIIALLKDDGDLDGLVKVLRNRADPDLRNEAADALGTMLNMEAVEPLARAFLQDPSLEVKKTARKALANLIGLDAETVIATYRHHLSTTGKWEDGGGDDSTSEEYLQNVSIRMNEAGLVDDVETVAGDSIESDQDQALSEWDQQNLEGMLTVLSHETNPKIRLQAIRALKNSNNMRAIETLSTIALQDDIPEIRQAARDVLVNRFGEDANAIIESYRVGSPDEEDLDEDLETEDEEPENDEETFQGPSDIPRTTSSFGNYSPSSVIQEDRIGWKVILLILLGILIVGGIAFLLIVR